MSTELNVLDPQSDAVQVGETLRLRRQMRGMSLKQVAEPAGISVGMLSQVERGLAAPSIKTLRAICSAMDMPVNWLFHRDTDLENQANEFIVQRNCRRSLTYNDGALIKELLTPDTQPQIQMLRFLMEPGADSGEPYSNTDGGKCGLVLQGTLGLELDARQFVINAGDSFAFPARSMVRFWTVGDNTCEVIWVVSPATV
ncbi:XRE family transcriptional regulator [Ochrobactrum sp. RH2CCR150]|uniref:helix-turn-helix domain-containing protein n=1 Tax=Ochrobactrum sp. RH2CCR150 TaxID=2587044 RepID=UPI0015FE4463|nr:transcriptional regulator with XRE-family HTH domain [Ochrobactrum sp. RH2CCR150]